MIRVEDTREHWVGLFAQYRRLAVMDRGCPALHAKWLYNMRQCRLMADQLDG